MIDNRIEVGESYFKNKAEEIKMLLKVTKEILLNYINDDRFILTLHNDGELDISVNRKYLKCKYTTIMDNDINKLGNLQDQMIVRIYGSIDENNCFQVWLDNDWNDLFEEDYNLYKEICIYCNNILRKNGYYNNMLFYI